jgi:hypothetical protein
MRRTTELVGAVMPLCWLLAPASTIKKIKKTIIAGKKRTTHGSAVCRLPRDTSLSFSEKGCALISFYTLYFKTTEVRTVLPAPRQFAGYTSIVNIS